MSKKEKEIKKIAAGSGYKLLSQRASKDLKSKRKKYDSPDDDDSPNEEEEVKKSIFKEHAARLKALRDKGLADEAYDIEEINSLEELILDLLPIAEENYRKFPIHTAGSCVNNYIATLTNLQADRRALQDLGARADRITNIFDNSCADIIRVVIDFTRRLQEDVTSKGSKDSKDLFKEYLRSIGKEVNNIKEKNSARVLQLVAAPKK
jgi:hypothetical protein